MLIDRVEPALKKLEAVILYDYPASQAALSQVVGNVAKRFEVYLKGVEICNAFKELTDPGINKSRYEESMERRKNLEVPMPEFDQDFYLSMKRGMKGCCGNALGFDRWLTILIKENDISTVIPFRSAAPYSRGNVL